MQKVYTKIESIVGNVITVRAKGVRNADLALVGDSYASVIKLDKDKVSLQVFAGAQGVSTTDPVRFLGRPMMVSFSDHLLGRIFDGTGVPRDNGPALTENMIPIGGPSFNPARGKPEAADLLHFRRAVQPAPVPDRHAGGGRYHHPRRHGPEI